VLFNVSQRSQLHLLASANVVAAGTLTLLIKMPATVTFYRGHRRTLCCLLGIISLIIIHTHTTVLRPYFWDKLGEPVPEENFWTLWCKGRFTEADIPTIRLGATPSGLTSAHLHHPPYSLQAGCPSHRPTNSVKALKASVLIIMCIGIIFTINLYNKLQYGGVI